MCTKHHISIRIPKRNNNITNFVSIISAQTQGQQLGSLCYLPTVEATQPLCSQPTLLQHRTLPRYSCSAHTRGFPDGKAHSVRRILQHSHLVCWHTKLAILQSPLLLHNSYCIQYDVAANRLCIVAWQCTFSHCHFDVAWPLYCCLTNFTKAQTVLPSGNSTCLMLIKQTQHFFVISIVWLLEICAMSPMLHACNIWSARTQSLQSCKHKWLKECISF